MTRRLSVVPALPARLSPLRFGGWVLAFLLGLLLARAAAGDISLITVGSTWRYWDELDPPGEGWQTPAFEDEEWSEGVASLGFGEVDGVSPFTVLAQRGQWTSYFRQPFFLADPAACTNFTLALLCDDGAVVWLNGQEIWRHGMPETEPILPQTPATSQRTRTFELHFASTSREGLPLLAGTNVLAVEVHHSPLWTHDLAFDFGLSADEVGRPGASVGANQRVFQSPATLQLTAAVWDDGAPLPADPVQPDVNDPHRLRWAWSAISAPAASQGVVWSGQPAKGEAFTYLGSPNVPGTVFTCDPSVTLDVPGLYVFEFQATDGEKTPSRRATVFLEPHGDLGDLGYAYLSPMPGAEYCPRRTRQLLVRFRDVAPADLANLDDFIAVAGSLSGAQAGRTRIASDGRTVIYELLTGLVSDELVTVTLTPRVAAGVQGAVEAFQFQFRVSGPMPESVVMPRGDAPELPLDPPFTPRETDEPGEDPGPSDPSLASGPRVTASGVAVPGDFPRPTVTVCREPAPGYLFLENQGQSGARYAMILDNDGSPLWYRRDSGWGLKVQSNGVITWGAFTGADQNFRVVGQYRAVNGFATDNHALKVLADGGYLLVGVHGQAGVDLSRYFVGGSTNAGVQSNVLQEFTAAGDLVLQFRAWDHFDIRDLDPAFGDPSGGSPIFSHMNAIDVDSDGHLLLSSRNLGEITKIHRDTGRVIWRLGGVRSSFTFVEDPLNGFRGQHDVSALGNGRYLLFDNGTGRQPPLSRAVEYEIDLAKMTARLVWQFRNAPDYYTPYMGSAQRLPNGNTLINFVGSAYPKVLEVDAQGEAQLELYLSPGTELYQAYRFPWNGVVAEPYLLLEAYPDNVTLIFNKFGDRAVDHYRIYSGVTPAPRTLLATSRVPLLRLTSLVNGVRNYFRVTAVSTTGIESPYSNEESLVVNILRPGQSQIANGDFSLGTAAWMWWASGNAQAEWRVNEGVAFIELTNAATQLSDVVLWQAGLKLLEGREHVLEFDAWAPQPRPLEVRLAMNQPPHTTWRTVTPMLTPSPQHFRYAWSMTGATDLDVRLTFYLGGSARDVYLDNVMLWTAARGDFNRDRRVDLEDLRVFTSQWLRQGPGLTADLNADQRVDFEDYALFAEDWSGSP